MKLRFSLQMALLGMSVALIPLSARADSDEWTGGTGDWVDPLNWFNMIPPGATSGVASTDIATFSSWSDGAVTVDAYRNVGGITFNNGASSYVLSSGTLVLTPSGTVQILSGAAATVQTINSAIGLAGTGTYTFINNSSAVGGSLTIGGGVSSVASGTAVFHLSGPAGPTGNLVSGSISDGAGVVAVAKSGAGTWTMSGSSSYTGGTTVVANGGKLVVSNGAALGTGPVNLAGTLVADTSALQLTGGITLAASQVQFGARNLVGSGGTAALQNLSGTNTITGTVLGVGSNIIIQSTSGKIIMSGTVTNNNNGAGGKSLYLEGAGDGEISGRITRPTNRALSIVMNSTGTWTLSNAAANNNYLGTTTVNAGTFLVNTDNTSAIGAIAVNGGTFGGNGINGGAATFAAGSFLSPGSSAGAMGVLTFLSTVDVSGLTSSTNRLVFGLGAIGSSDQVALTAGVLNIGTLGLDDFSFSTAAGFGAGSYTLFNTAQTITGALGGTLTGTLDGYNIELAFANGSQDVVLNVSAIPEPSVLGLAILGLAGLAARRWRSTDLQE